MGEEEDVYYPEHHMMPEMGAGAYMTRLLCRLVGSRGRSSTVRTCVYAFKNSFPTSNGVVGLFTGITRFEKAFLLRPPV